MVYAVVNINGQAAPAEVTFGNITTGTGNIRVWTSNSTVIGNTTTFTTQLSNLSVLRTEGNVYIGRIKMIANNTYATLTANANVAVANLGFHYQTTTITEITSDPSLGQGNISTFAANNTILGSNTAFMTQLSVGYQLFDKDNLNFIGEVQSIRSNTQAFLTTVSAYPQSNMAFRFYSPYTKNRSNLYTAYNNNIHTSLINWGKSGLIQNITQVKSYHLPVPDPVTGVLVNFPATIHESKTLGNIVAHNYDENHLNNVNNSQTSSDAFVVKLFDDDNKMIGGSTVKAVNSVPLNKVVSKLAAIQNDNANFGNSVATITNTVYGAPKFANFGIVVDSVPEGFTAIKPINSINSNYDVYQGPGGNIVYVMHGNVNLNHVNTQADRISHLLNLTPPNRITDQAADANSYFSVKDQSTLTDADKSNLAARAVKEFSGERPKMLKASGVPAGIPGLLNVILHDEDPAKRPYVEPKYYRPPGPNLPSSYNPDLPPSPINIPPSEF